LKFPKNTSLFRIGQNNLILGKEDHKTAILNELNIIVVGLSSFDIKPLLFIIATVEYGKQSLIKFHLHCSRLAGRIASTQIRNLLSR